MTRDELLTLIRHDPEVRSLLADAVMQTVAARVDNRKQRPAAAHGAGAADVADRQPAPVPPLVEPEPFGDDDRIELTDLGRDALRTRSEQAVG